MVTVIITLTAVLGFIYIKRVKNQKDDIPVATNEACGAGLQDTAIYAGGNTYDNPRGNDRARSSIDTKMNEAYAMHAEAKPCIAYATSAIKPRVAYEVPTNAMTKPCAAYGICTSAVTNPRVAYATDITTEGNDAYGITLQDVAMCGKRDAHDHPNIDS